MAASTVPLTERAVLSIPQLAQIVGCSHTALYARLVVDESRTDRATFVIPGGAVVPCWRDALSSQWRIYRSQFDKAVEAHGQQAATA